MGLLGDVYSYGDGLKRKLRGLLDDPMGTIEQGVRNFGEDQNGLLNLAENAYPMPGNRTVLNTPEQIAGFRKELAGKGAEQAMAAATVWHGSPHKFDKFDSSKIGTGEGAQAYGHGLYLAESPEVAGEYARMNISGPGQVAHVGKKNGPDGAMAALKNAYPKMPKQWYESAIAKADDAGNTYKVDLPDEHIAKMLDWDKPLSQQHPDVQASAMKLAGPEMERLAKTQSAYMPNIQPLDTLTGEELYRRMVSNLGAQKIGGQGAALSAHPDAIRSLGSVGTTDALRDAGIPGIRYLDGGSRGAGGGTSNFVIFPGNEGLLSILERNGAALK